MFATKLWLTMSALIVGSGLIIATIAPSIAATTKESTTEPKAVAGGATGAATSASGTAASGDNAQEIANDGGAADALGNPQRIAEGQALWQKQCRHCHGRSAYPGKAPKLKPRKYKAQFVYRRVTDGFRKMPPWKAVFDDKQRWSIVAFVMSKEFSP